MNEKGKNSSSGGVGFFGLLTIVFIVLKLTDYIDWSWLWVLSPIWMCGGIILIIIAIILIVGAIKNLLD